MKNLARLVGLSLLLSFASSAFAQLDAPWTASGTGIVTVVEDGASGIAQMTYDARGPWSGSWKFVTIADKDKTITLSYNYQWLHSWYMSRVGFSAFINGVSIPLQPGQGEVELQLRAGDSYGFYMTGSHYDSSRLLLGTLTIALVGDNSDAMAQEECEVTLGGTVDEAGYCVVTTTETTQYVEVLRASGRSGRGWTEMGEDTTTTVKMYERSGASWVAEPVFEESETVRQVQACFNPGGQNMGTKGQCGK